MKKNFILIASICFLTIFNLQGEVRFSPGRRKAPKKDTSEMRTGWTFGILPSVAYDADKGFQYGLLSNVYYFGDGSSYPEYLHSLYFEAAYTTKRSGIFRFSYDSKFLIPTHRFKFDISCLPDAMNDFYGYNGYQSVFKPEWCNKKSREEDYKSRAFYKSRRDLFRVAADIDGRLGGNWYWDVGIGLLGYQVDTVNRTMINRKKDIDRQLPDIEGLYEKYVKWGIIGASEANGSWQPYLRCGFTYDNRDRQQNTRKGINADIFFTYNAAFGEDKKFNNLIFNADFRHFVPIYGDHIIFAYRLATQLLVAGQSPFYLNNYYNNLFIQRVLYEGLGGGNTLRGIRRNRITSNGYAFANVEFRFKICKFNIKKEYFYIGLNPFLDAGMVLLPYKLNEEEIIHNIRENDRDFNLADLPDYLILDRKEARIYRPHLAAGIGLKIMMNDNFVLSVDWAMPFDRRDNDSRANIYVKMGFMF